MTLKPVNGQSSEC